MPVQLFANNAVTLLDADILAGDLTLTLTTGDGALFPSPTAGDWFYATIELGSLREIVQVTSRAVDTLTIVRGQDGTAASGWTAGAKVELRLTKVWLDTIHTEASLPVASIGDVSGPGSSSDNDVALFDGTTGKLLKTSGLGLSGSNTGDQVISDATISTTDISTNDVSTTKHGFAPKGTDVGHFLADDGAYQLVPAMQNIDPVINGSMNLWQREDTFTGVATTDMVADQYEIDFVTSVGVMDVVQVSPTTSVIHPATGQRINHALRVNVTTIDASIATTELVTLSQKIEGYRAAPFTHNVFTVSFYVRSNLTGQFAFAVGNAGDDRNYIHSFSPAVADTWERIVVTVPTQDFTGTWDYQNGIGLLLRWGLVAGTDHEGTDNVWNSTADFAVTGQVNFLSDVSNYFELTGVQIDMGTLAKPFRGAPIEQDLVAASRYFQSSYDLGVFPGATSAAGQVSIIQNGTTHKESVRFGTPMGDTPTVTAYNPTDGTAAEWEDVGVGGEAVTITNAGMKGFTVNVTAGSDGLELNGHWTAESRL